MVGGGGAVGLAAIQLAVAAGCNVSTTCGSQSIDQVLAIGAKQAIDYTSEVTILSYILYTSLFCESSLVS